jgi:hypothetical protein
MLVKNELRNFSYKEAYFLIPELKPLFDKYPTPISFGDTPIDLLQVYLKMADGLTNDKNLTANFQRACNRIGYLDSLNISDIAQLQKSWIESFRSTEETHQNQLIHALLTIHQVKDYWKAITPIDKALPQQRFEEQLTLEIGKFYSQQPRDSEHHIPSFFNILSKDNN